MPALRIGQSEILYELRRSATTSERRITVTPGHVEVLALTTDDDDAVAGFIERKRHWLFNTVRQMEHATAKRHAVPRFMTGSKIPYRGRKMPLIVRRSDSERIEISYKNGFVVDLPSWAGELTDRLVADELKLWLKQKVRRDVREIATSYNKKFGLCPRSIRIAELSDGWGSCGLEGNILINWQLIFAPRKILEYVVAHELVHLKHRSHDKAFWSELEKIMPNFSAPYAWLKKHDAILSSDFLRV